MILCIASAFLLSVVTAIITLRRDERRKRRVMAEVRRGFDARLEMHKIMREEYIRYARNRKYKR